MPTPLTSAELDRLSRYANDWQKEVIEAVRTEGSYRKAAVKIGRDHTAVINAINRARVAAEKQGDSPDHDWTHTVPESHLVKGVSSYYGEDGQLKGQWVKSQLKDEERFRQLEAFAQSLADSVKGKAKATKAPKVDTKDKLCVYPMGDPHLGMYAWAEEAGENFDLKIASRDLQAATARLVDSCPATEQAVILNLGDFFHTDTADNVTSRSGNRLDVDTRWANVMDVGEIAMRGCIDVALAKHRTVHVRNVIGNHDDHSSYALSKILSAYYHNEPRVSVDTSPSPFWYFRFGKVLLGATHGHSVKPERLLSIMAHDRSKDWGETEFRYWYLGHYHTKIVHEVGSLLIEYFRTLAAKDKWTNDHGYRSGRDMNAIVHHKDYGEIERHRADILMVRS